MIVFDDVCRRRASGYSSAAAMFIYLAKKIAIPHGIKLESVAWNSEQGWIACGGANGLLKVLKLESKAKKKKGEDAQPSNLSMNQTLEGHNGFVKVVTWNENYRKLTTSDEYGLIIVWMLHKGMWFEEMINNRNKSVVKDMKWTADGQKICIIYADGAVIVGSVDGNRLWGKELDIELAFVEWSPDGRNILFGTANGEVHLYDNIGNHLTKLTIYAASNAASRIIGLQWYNGAQGYLEAGVPSLAICYDNGRCQIMRDENDDNPILIDTLLNLAHKMEWNTNGSVLAIAGTKLVQLPTGEQKESQMVQFYTPYGKHLRTLKVMGSGISSLSWEGGSLRLALAVDSFIYFANIRPDYKWGYFSNTLVYAFNKPDRPENCVCFWDTATDERHIKYVKKLIAIRAAGENCVFATRTEDNSGQFILILCNAIGSPVDSKYIDIEPIHITMTPYHVCVANESLVYVWQYRTAADKLTSLKANDAKSPTGAAAAAAAGAGAAARGGAGRELLFHIDDPPTPENEGKNKKLPDNLSTKDGICALTASTTTLVLGRESGTLMRFALPAVVLENRYVVRLRPQLLSLNCESKRLSIIDINGVLTLFDLDARAAGPKGPIGKALDFERKDAWDMKWSDDNPELLAVMEKNRMYVFRDLKPEEPVNSSCYLCQFSDLCIKTVQMDDIISDPEHPDKECVVNFDTKSLRDTRELLASAPIAEAYTFVEDNPHPRLWRILAEAALEQLNFQVADKAFVRCQDYQGIQFVKRLKLLSDRNKQRAEVAAYFRRFDEAESIFLNMDQKDLAVELRTRLGDWFRVVQLVQSGAGDDRLLNTAWNNIGDYYADRQKWQKAQKYYAKAKNLKELVNCAYVLDDYSALDKLVDQFADGSELLRSVGDKFQSVGLCEEAVRAFSKAGDTKSAIDCCVLLNQWDQAVKLAEQHSFPQIEGLLTKYATHLLNKQKLFQAVELYRKANKSPDAAKLLCKLALESGATKVHPLRAKKLYVLAAMEMDRFKKRMLDPNAVNLQNTQATLQTLLDHDHITANNKQLDNPWRGAEAYHFWMLAQRQLYGTAYAGAAGAGAHASSGGSYESAMRTAIRLMEYEDILDAREIYSLVALTAFYNKYYGQCSRAFIKLESLEGLTKDEHDKYKKLAVSIFTRNAPKDPPAVDAKHALPGSSVIRYKCTSSKCHAEVRDYYVACPDCNKPFAACVITGRAILTQNETVTCKSCKHQMFEREMRRFVHCPLCHAPLVPPQQPANGAAAAGAGAAAAH